jgi:hypothetical protein
MFYLSNVAMAFGVKTIAEYEGTGKCVIIKIYNAFDWSTISKSKYFARKVTVKLCIIDFFSSR